MHSDIGPFSKAISSPFTTWVANDHGFLNKGQCLKLIGAGFFIFVPVFVT